MLNCVGFRCRLCIIGIDMRLSMILLRKFISIISVSIVVMDYVCLGWYCVLFVMVVFCFVIVGGWGVVLFVVVFVRCCYMVVVVW